MTKELNPGVYVVLPGGETEHWVPEEMNEPAKRLGHALGDLVGFFQFKWSSLTHEDATLLAAAVVESLPTLLQDNPDLLQGLSQIADDIKAGRFTTK